MLLRTRAWPSTLHAYLKPKPLMITESLKFYRQTQQEGESVTEYVVALKELSMHCDFGNFLHDALRDCLVCGFYKGVTQKRLLTEAELMFKKVCEISLVMEMADNNTRELKLEETKLSINVLKVAWRK